MAGAAAPRERTQLQDKLAKILAGASTELSLAFFDLSTNSLPDELWQLDTLIKQFSLTSCSVRDVIHVV